MKICKFIRSMRVMVGWNRRDRCEFPPLRIPWAMIAPHDKQAKLNHAGQDLARLESRGGVSADEALAILDNRRWKMMDENEAYEELARRIRIFTENVESSHGAKPPTKGIQ